MNRLTVISMGGLVILSVLFRLVHAEIIFTDLTETAGTGAEVYQAQNAHSLGVNWIDFNKDGWPDLFAVNGFMLPPHLYQNNGDGTFTKVDELLPLLPGYEMGGSVFADYDNDGDSDIYIFTDTDDGQFTLSGTNDPEGAPNFLLKNLFVENGNQVVEGQPLFEEVAVAAGVHDDFSALGYAGLRSMAGGWFDYNRDGCVDLYVGHWVLNIHDDGDPTNDIATKDRFYRNNCDGTFTDVTVASNLNTETDPDTYRQALGFIGAHLGNDSWPDLYVVNMHPPAPYNTDFLFKNNGNSTFMDVTGLSPGIGDDTGSGMGIDVADIDLDGDWDIYISDRFDNEDAIPPGNALYLGNGDGTFMDNTADLAGVSNDFSWGVNFFDVDLDGYEDLYVATQSVVGNLRDKHLYMNNQDIPTTFTDMGVESGISDQIWNSRGSAVADFDNDGDLDVAVVNQNGPLQIFRNDTTEAGNWLKVKLVPDVTQPGPLKTNRDAIGAVVKVFRTGQPDMIRQVKGGSSAHSQNSLNVHFGLGSTSTVKEVRVIWPSGIEDVICGTPSSSFLEIPEGSTDATVLCPDVSGGGGGSDDSGACFIATAAYGSVLEPEVQWLRAFRDQYLIPFQLGREFVELYYRYSPPAAQAIGQHEGLRVLVRLLLWPLIALAWFLIGATVMVKLGICAGFAVTGWSAHRFLRWRSLRS